MTQDLSRPFLIAETKSGRATPHAIWDADNETNYVNRVRAANSRSCGALDIETAEQAAAFTEECDASSVSLITEADFNGSTLDSWDSRIVDRAIALGWIETPALEHAGY